MKRQPVLVSLWIVTLLLVLGVLPASASRTSGLAGLSPEAAIAAALNPATLDAEIGYDFVLSSMGPHTDPDYDALNPAVAYKARTTSTWSSGRAPTTSSASTRSGASG